MALPSFHIPATLAVALAVSLSAATYEVAQRAPGASDAGDGTPAHPWKTIGRAARQTGPGDTVVIGDGIYREQVVVKVGGTAQAPLRFEAAPGAQVVLTGADPLTRWQKVGAGRPVYQTPWPYRFLPWSPHLAHPDDPYHRLIGRCEQVAVQGYLLRQVLDPSQLAPGTFYADLTNQVLEAWDPANRDLRQLEVEAAVRQEILHVEADEVEVSGLRFRFAANMAQHGAVFLAGRRDLLEDCVIEAMNASGAAFTGPDEVARRCVFRDNGQLGFGAHHAHHLLVTESRIENNNTKGFDRGWEAGGDKLVLCRHAVLERSRFLRNRGAGIWFDIGNEDCEVRQCLIAENEDAGVFDEISFGLQAHDNVIVGNGFAATPGAWGAQAGIVLSSSPYSRIERNLILGNREGFNFREQARTTPRLAGGTEEAVWNHDETIQHNLIALNRDAQVWGWFDLADDRPWPGGAGQHQRSEPSATAKPTDLAAAYGARPGTVQPHGLALETLHLRFLNNVYATGPGQGAFRWGVPWRRHQSYDSLPEFRRDLELDVGGRVLDLPFANARALDCRLPAASLSQVRECYPHGPIPGVRLGASP